MLQGWNGQQNLLIRIPTIVKTMTNHTNIASKIALETRFKQVLNSALQLNYGLQQPLFARFIYSGKLWLT